ncbi:LuxR C-terminal-related transcriptional regulator [Microbacterium sp. SYP-A9085]|uniref:LuxR C-terminal-related transcriptional regulator n=1 Tax=Microbacterium sp. SYP-A9085 TaxID=2664454 RepID=UPI001562E3C5|nr:LuxR C-terminal-related transcriptional regulator [Microbacterium sp. SYP-A9085]
MGIEPADMSLPRVPAGVISRRRVLALLDERVPLTVVRAACGMGKTVVLREWALHTDDRVVWITADPNRSDSRALAGAILNHCRRDHDGNGVEPASWSEVSACLADSSRPTTVVVDDAAVLKPGALLDLCAVVATEPTLHVIVATNQRTVLDGDGVALLLDRKIIGPTQLLFDRAEVRRLLRTNPRTAQEVLAATNGFPAAIHALAKRGLPQDEESIAAVAAAAVEDYVRFRLVRFGHDRGVLNTLVKISFMSAVDAELACELSGDPHAADALKGAEIYGFGSWTEDPHGPRFRFTPFALVLLRRELMNRYPQDVHRMRKAGSAWLLRNGDPVEALRLAVDGDDLGLAREVVTSSWHRLLDHAPTVRKILDPVPLSRLRDEPLVMILLGMSYTASQTRRAHGLQTLRVALMAAKSQSAASTGFERLIRLVFESSALRVLQVHDRAAALAEQALQLLLRSFDIEKESNAAQVPLISAQLGTSLYYGGKPRRAIDCLTYGTAILGVRHENAIDNLSMLSGIHALNGDLPEARHCVDLIRSGRWDRTRLNGTHGMFYRLAESLLALEESDTAGAVHHIAAFEQQRATSEHWPAMAAVEALVSLCQGQAAMGESRLESLVQLHGGEGVRDDAIRPLRRVRSLLALAQGRMEASKSFLDGHTPEDRHATRVDRARVALAENRPRDALQILGRGDGSTATSRVKAEATAIRTAAMLRIGSIRAARHEAQNLGALLHDRGLRMPLALLPPADVHPVHDILRSETPYEIDAVESVLHESLASAPLTDRERVVLKELASDKSLTMVAGGLGVSHNTVKTHVKSIYRKLEVSTREEAVAVAVARLLMSDKY